MPDDPIKTGEAWLPGPLEPIDDRPNRKYEPGLKQRFNQATYTDSGNRENSTASMSIDTEKRRNPQGRKQYGNKNYHQWETEKGDPNAGPRRAGPTESPGEEPRSFAEKEFPGYWIGAEEGESQSTRGRGADPRPRRGSR